MVSFVNQSGKSKGFSSTPVNTSSTIDRLLTSLENFNDLWVEIAIWRQSRNLVSDIAEYTNVDSSVLQLAVFFCVSFDLSPLCVDPFFNFKLQVLALSVSFL